MKRGLLIPDCHIPYECQRSYEIMLKVARDFKPHEVVILGDYLDCYSISAHAKEAYLPSMLNIEINAASERLRELEKLFPRARKVFIEGNHCFRLQRYIRDKCPELFGLIDLPSILKIKDKWHWVPYTPEQKYRVLNSKLFARHEPIGTSSKTTASRGICSVAFGHTHRIESNQVVGLDNTQHVAFSCGWLGDRKQKVFSYVKSHAQWTEGFAVVYVDERTRNFYHQVIPIINYSCVFNGKRYKG